MKDIVFVDNALARLRAFTSVARREAGYQLDRVQQGLEPADWKPMRTVGPGVYEIRIHAQGEYRVLYVTKFVEAVYVLHAFQKKTQKTAQRDIDLAKQRYQAVISARQQQ